MKGSSIHHIQRTQLVKSTREFDKDNGLYVIVCLAAQGRILV